MAITASGDYWRIEDGETLYITCAGDMPDYDDPYGEYFPEVERPWVNTGVSGFNCETDIRSVIIDDSVTGIGNYAFAYFCGLAFVRIPYNLEDIGDYAFAYCSNLRILTLPERAYIGENAFMSCGFSHLTLPSEIGAISSGAFSSCSNLTSIDIPDGIVSIYDGAFFHCESLTSVTIPDSVTFIGYGAFASCGALANVLYEGTQAQWNAIAIEDDNAPLVNATKRYNYAPPPLAAPEVSAENIGNPLAAVALAHNQLTRAFLQLRTTLASLPDEVKRLIGNDANKSARTIARQELAAQLIPANAQASLDTLQEIAAWIQAHPADAAALNAKLTLGTHEVSGQQVQYDTVEDYVTAMVSGLITLSALSAAVSGNGNAVTSLAYNSATGAFTATKGATFLTEHQDISGKVDKVPGKGLSTEDYTTAEKSKLAGIPADATANVAATAAPLMDGTAAVGNSDKYARENHVHPTDTSRASAADVAALQEENAVFREYFANMEVYRTASGNPAIFSDGYAANVRKLAVTLTPTQSGSGDPSLSNIRPISGVSSVTVTRTGRNLAPISLQGTTGNGLTFTDNGDGSVTASGTLNAGATNGYTWPVREIYLTPGETYALSGSPGNGCALRVAGTNWSALWQNGGYRADTGSGTTFTCPADGVVRIQMVVEATAGEQANLTARPYLRLADADSAYEAYQGQSVTVALLDGNNDPLTVYGGTLDVTAGTLSVTHKKIQVTGQENITMNSRGAHVLVNDIFRLDRHNGNNGKIFTTCDCLPSFGWNGLETADVGVAIYYYGGLGFRNVALSSAEEYAAWLAELQPEIVYPLETPVTYTLTAQQLAALSGYNSVSADSGSVTVEYRADAGLSLG